MKNIILSACALLIISGLAAQSERYTTAMKTNIDRLDSALRHRTMPELANNFERIAEAEKNQWLPYYYAAYCNVMNSYMQEDKSKSDVIADKAEQLITKAEQILGKENSETSVIRSMIASAHMMVDPQNRWQQYGETVATNIAKAKTMDPSNPRPVFLEGQTKFYTPESFGGGKAPAKELFIKALKMFDSFKPESNLHPSWGKTSTEYFLSQCN